METTTTRKLCRDCRHYELRASGIDTCTRIEWKREPDLVRGDPQPTYAEVMRQTRCGRSGKFWEPVPVAPRVLADIDFPAA